jgi:hypothetical protein
MYSLLRNKKGQFIMSQSTFVNDQGEIVATGRITPSFIDLKLIDGTRFYSTFTYNALQSLNIAKAIQIGVQTK